MEDSKADLGLLLEILPPIVVIRNERGRAVLQAPPDMDGVFLGHIKADEFLGWMQEELPDMAIDLYSLQELSARDYPLQLGLVLSKDTLEALTEAEDGVTIPVH